MIPMKAVQSRSVTTLISFWLAGLLLVLPLTASTPAESAAEEENGEDGAVGEFDIDARMAEELYMLGYARYADESASGDDGVTVLDRSRASPGYTLHVNHGLCSAQLMDVEGKVLHEWSESACQYWSHARLLPNGDLLVVAAGEAANTSPQSFVESRYVERRDWSGAVRWRSTAHAHHDSLPLEDGSYFALTLELRNMPSLDATTPIMDNALTRMSAKGNAVESLSLTELLLSAPTVIELKLAPRRRNKRFPWLNLIHANSIDVMQHEELISHDHIYALGNVLISSRKQDAIFILGWEQKELLWAWGPGELDGPHDASVLENGNIMIFDNGKRRGWSRVIELNPVSRKIEWAYQAPKRKDFYSVSRGSAQRLPNGNTLIANSNNGTAFEITRGGEVVWEWRNPKRDKKGRRATIIRMDRYAPSFVEPILSRYAE
jgi:hypothetical protein